MFNFIISTFVAYYGVHNGIVLKILANMQCDNMPEHYKYIHTYIYICVCVCVRVCVCMYVCMCACTYV